MLYHSARGSVNYTIVGSPAIVDGILENPNQQNYIKTDTTFQDTGEDFRLHVEFVRTISRTVPVLGTNQTGGARPLLALDAGKPRFRIGTGVNIYGVQSLWRTNTPYAIEVSRTGNIWTLKSFINGNQVDIQTLESSALLNDGAAFTWVFGCDFAVYGGGIGGNIDLNKTYINYDKEAWFGICPIEVKKHQIMGPVGYTVVGSPTITDGVASGFSNSDYLLLNLNIPLDVQIIEIYSKITTPTVWHTGGYIGTILARTSYDAVGLTLTDYHKLQGKIKTNNTMYTIATDEALSVNTTYYVKYVYNKNAGKLSIGFSTDNQNWIEAERSDISSEGILVSGGNYRIGQGSFGYFRGSIDLNQTYIKVNGKLWFWQPRETEKIVVNGVEVWQKSS